MWRNRIIVVISFFLLFSCASSMTPRANTRQDVVSYVNSAASVVTRSGPSCDTFANPHWRSGDWYLFVIGPDGRLVCHPNPDMVGKPQSDIVDAKGLHVTEALLAAASSAAGHGWVDYVWPRPGQTTPVPKSAYVTRVTGSDGKSYVVGAGGYELK